MILLLWLLLLLHSLIVYSSFLQISLLSLYHFSLCYFCYTISSIAARSLFSLTLTTALYFTPDFKLIEIFGGREEERLRDPVYSPTIPMYDKSSVHPSESNGPDETEPSRPNPSSPSAL
ncbi:hypothetical protein VNO78_13376 [Psophocarpus tetragonolobus]|uniref:Uncharacterized protein n=1 Tax=Psophocarpus tetragonolobus TaxID=3891 RepID=A0AAN9SP32_PSOTE